MKQIITAKLKLLTTPEQHNKLRQTQLAYRDALNYTSAYAFEHGKTSNENGLHYEVRGRLWWEAPPLPVSFNDRTQA